MLTDADDLELLPLAKRNNATPMTLVDPLNMQQPSSPMLYNVSSVSCL